MNHILLIAGAPSSGKSTLARETARLSPKGLHIPVDDLRGMVQGGLIHPGEQDDWSPKLKEQLELARRTAVDMAVRYCTSNFLVAIDDFWDPNSQLHEYAALSGISNVTRIILCPSLATNLTRLHARQAPSAFRDVLENAIRLVYEDLAQRKKALSEQGWHFMDTSNETIEVSVKRIFGLLENLPI